MRTTLTFIDVESDTLHIAEFVVNMPKGLAENATIPLVLDLTIKKKSGCWTAVDEHGQYPSAVSLSTDLKSY